MDQHLWATYHCQEVSQINNGSMAGSINRGYISPTPCKVGFYQILRYPLHLYFAQHITRFILVLVGYTFFFALLYKRPN
jgi:hypothetical protein